MSEQLIDTSPLPKAVNACRWNAAQLRATLARVQIPDAQRKQLEQSIAWLDELGRVVLFEHQNPILLLAVGNLVLNVRDRELFLAALQAIEKATVEASGGGTAAKWAPVE
jgi:hypothetical protein